MIRGTASNADGRTPTISSPSLDAQVAAYWAALDVAGVDPDTIGAIEAHGNKRDTRVRAEGLEPSSSSEHGHLKPACLPKFHHARSVAIVPRCPLANLSVLLDSLGSSATKGAHACGLKRSSTQCGSLSQRV